MNGFNMKNTFFSCVTVAVLVLSVLFLYEPAQNVLCSLAIFERFLIDTPRMCSLFDAARLSRYDGADGGKIYLSILGVVFDVSDGRRFYGPGGSYRGFSGEQCETEPVTERESPEAAAAAALLLLLRDSVFFFGKTIWCRATIQTNRTRFQVVTPVVRSLPACSTKTT